MSGTILLQLFVMHLHVFHRNANLTFSFSKAFCCSANATTSTLPCVLIALPRITLGGCNCKATAVFLILNVVRLLWSFCMNCFLQVMQLSSMSCAYAGAVCHLLLLSRTRLFFSVLCFKSPYISCPSINVIWDNIMPAKVFIHTVITRKN